MDKIKTIYSISLVNWLGRRGIKFIAIKNNKFNDNLKSFEYLNTPRLNSLLATYSKKEKLWLIFDTEKAQWLISRGHELCQVNPKYNTADEEYVFGFKNTVILREDIKKYDKLKEVENYDKKYENPNSNENSC